MVSDSVSSNIDQVLLINFSAVFVFGDFSIHHMDWFTYSGGTDRSGELSYNFSFSNTSQSCSFGFIFSDASICSAIAFPPLKKSDHVVVLVSIGLHDIPKGMSCFTALLMTIFVLIETLWVIIWEIFHWKVFLNYASAAASEFYEWFQVWTDVYVPHRKYQVKPHLFPRFSAACAAAIVHRNHFFRLYLKDKSSKSKVKFRKASNCCKRVLEAVKLAYANKRKESITS